MGRGRLGSQQGMARTMAARQITAQPRYQVSALSAMDDAHLSVALDDIFANTPVESNQQDTDTQRFFNAIGWSDELPEVVDESAFFRAALAAKRRDGQRFQMLFHTDAEQPHRGVPDAQVYADQFMKGKQFQSGGYHGDGAYFASSADVSWGYGSGGKSTQFRAVLNDKAKVISESNLDARITSWKKKHPKAYQKLANCEQAYFRKNSDSLSGVRSVFAAIFGYNVIRSSQSRGTYTVPNRSVLTVHEKVIHRDEWSQGSTW